MNKLLAIEMPVLISVIIATKNRHNQLNDCLKALKNNSFKNFELIIVDQSQLSTKETHLQKILEKFSKFKYLNTTQIGKSKSLNLAIKLSSTNILAFTDDDCIPSKNWLLNIFEAMKNNPQVAATFGRTLPYQKHKHPGLVCPATFESKKKRYITQPCKHWEKIGFGNNMAWRKSFFEKHGLFKEWLGPGSIGSNAEDAEIALRALINKKTILYQPKILLYHNKWLTPKERQRAQLSYICGEMACYGYYSLLGYPFAKEVIKINKNRINQNIKQLISAIFHLKRDVIAFMISLIFLLLFILRGLLVSISFFFLKKAKTRI